MVALLLPRSKTALAPPSKTCALADELAKAASVCRRPLTLNTALPLMVSADVVLNALSVASSSVPWFRVVLPLYVPRPDSVNVPLPFLMRPPLVPAISPLKVVLALLAPTPSVVEPMSMRPAPAMEPRFCAV